MVRCQAGQVIVKLRDNVPAENSLPDLAGLELGALESALEERGHQRFRARQIFRWIHRHGVTDLAHMTDLSHGLRATLATTFALTTPIVEEREKSVDGTEKFLLRLAD